jgi:phage replication initiation protein
MAKKDLTPAATEKQLRAAVLNPSDLEIIYAQTQESIRLARERQAAARASVPKAAARAAQHPPLSNTGGTYREARLVTEDGKVLEIPARRGWGGDSAFVDWVNFTCHDSSFFMDGVKVCDEDVIRDVSAKCYEIFGFGITQIREGGMNFYQRSYVLGDKWGFVCHGGQRDTVLVQLSGAGCTAAKEGWELRLQTFLEERATCGRITRIDLAFDDFDGQNVSVESLESDYDKGLFQCKFASRNPDIELRGNWKNPNGKGRTVYVGNRANGKFFRGYEKGCQLGQAFSPWVRCEVEFKSVDRIIPFDVLTRAGEYLAASYPALAFISERQERIITTKKTVEASYDRMKTWLHDQCGVAINLLFEIEGDAKKVIDLIRKEGKIPARMKVPDYRFGGDYIHESKPETLPFEVFLDWSFSQP